MGKTNKAAESGPGNFIGPYHVTYMAHIAKVVAHERRIMILLLLQHEGPLTLDQIAQRTKTETKNAHQHVYKMYEYGFIYKKQLSNYVLHSLSPFGREVLTYMCTIDQSTTEIHDAPKRRNEIPKFKLFNNKLFSD